MEFKPITEQELDISMAKGFLEEWLKESPEAVRDNLKTIVDGVSLYRQKYLDIQEDYNKTLESYNRLTALSSLYLQQISQQKEQIDQLLIDTQRDLHRTE